MQIGDDRGERTGRSGRAAARSWRAIGRRVAHACVLAGLLACDSVTEPDPNTPAVLLVHAGDFQIARAGEAVEVPPEVRVVSEAGTAVSGVVVTFAVTEGSGSVGAASAETGADGVASAGSWTLGGQGLQRLEATAPGLPAVVFEAGASGLPAAIEVVSGDGQAVIVGSEVPEVLVVRVTDDTGAPLAFAPVTFVADYGTLVGQRTFTDEEGLASVRWTLGTKSGRQVLSAAVAGSGVVGNPAEIIVTALPARPQEVRLSAGEENEPEIGFAAPSARAQVVDAHGNGVPHVALTFRVLEGGGTVSAEPMYTDENGDVFFTWVMGPDAGAANTVAVTSMSVGYDVTGVTVSLTVYPEKPDFDVVLLYSTGFLHDTGLSAGPIVREAVEAAKENWESIVRGDTEETFFEGLYVANCNRSSEFNLPESGMIDDLLVLVSVEDIDGPGGSIGNASWCFAQFPSLATVSVLQFDESDLMALVDSGLLDDAAIHLMAHALGLGGSTIWGFTGLLAEQGGSWFFTGAGATAAFDAAGGADFAGPKVPLDAPPNPTFDFATFHWSASVFGLEVLAPLVLTDSAAPISRITLAALEDMGYTEIDYSKADDYRLPDPKAAAGVIAGGKGLLLHDDTPRLTRRYTDADGNIHVIEPPDRVVNSKSKR